MNETIEKLKAIRAKCEELLETAKARREYPHKWEAHGKRVAFLWGDGCHGGYWLESCELDEGTAAFIASCAGPAEAGWRSTIAAIDFFNHLREIASDEPWLMADVGRKEVEIITAWEGLV